MHPNFRKFIAGSQIAGGIALSIVPIAMTRAGSAVTWWYWTAFIVIAAAAVAAGVWLWRDEARGWSLSKVLQALQIVQFQTSSFGFALLVGLQLRLQISETEFTIRPAFSGTAALLFGTGLPWFVSINFLAAYALYALLRSRPGDAPRGTDAPAITQHPAGRRFVDRVEP